MHGPYPSCFFSKFCHLRLWALPPLFLTDPTDTQDHLHRQTRKRLNEPIAGHLVEIKAKGTGGEESEKEDGKAQQSFGECGNLYVEWEKQSSKGCARVQGWEKGGQGDWVRRGKRESGHVGEERMIWTDRVFFAIIPARGALIELYLLQGGVINRMPFTVRFGNHMSTYEVLR